MLDKIIVNKLLIKFGDAGAVNSSRTKENVDVVNDLVLSQKDTSQYSQTH